MAIGLHTEGSWVAANATTQVVTLPTHSTGDMLIVRVGMKHATLPGDITINQGFTQIDEFNNGTTASGNGSGDVEIVAFWKQAASGAETNPTVTFHASVAATPSCAVATAFSKDAAETWETPVGDSGAIAAATSYSATMASHITAQTGDWLVGFAVTNDNTTLTVPTIAQTGLTLAAVVESPATALSSATSNDISADGCYRVVNSGTSSAAAVFSGTNSVADVGAAMVIRLRVGVAVNAAAELASGTGTAYNALGVDGYAAEILTDGPSFLAPLGEASGNVRDIIGGLVGTVNGNPTYGVAGGVTFGTGIDFDGTGDYISFPDDVALDLGDGPFTLEVWLKRDAITASYGLIAKQSSGPYFLRIDNTDHIVLGQIAVGNVLADNATLTDTTDWHHIVATWDGTSDSKLYIDGSARTSTFNDRTLTDSALALIIGAADTSSQFLNGRLQYIAIYKTELSGARISAHYAARQGAAATNAAAGLASGTGAANQPSIDIKTNAGLSSGTGLANNAAPGVKPNAGLASGTGLANNAATSVKSAPNVATGTGAANQPSISIKTNAGLASGTGLANDATGLASKTVAAGLASGTGLANNSSVAIATSAGLASGTGLANTASANVAPNAGLASGTGTANNPGISTIDAADAGVATGTGQANGGSANVAPNAGLASGTGTAYDPTVSTASATNAAAGLASGTGQAFNATITILSNPGVASGTGQAFGPAASIATSAGGAAGSGTAGGPSPAIQTGAGLASGTGTAYDATISTTAAANAAAGLASGSGDAFGASISIKATAGNAAGAGTAFNPISSVSPNAGNASGTGTAYDATGTQSGGTTNAAAGLASGVGVAYDATILAVSPSDGGGAGHRPRTRGQMRAGRRVLVPVEITINAVVPAPTVAAVLEVNDDEVVLELLAGIL